MHAITLHHTHVANVITIEQQFPEFFRSVTGATNDFSLTNSSTASSTTASGGPTTPRTSLSTPRSRLQVRRPSAWILEMANNIGSNNGPTPSTTSPPTAPPIVIDPYDEAEKVIQKWEASLLSIRHLLSLLFLLLISNQNDPIFVREVILATAIEEDQQRNKEEGNTGEGISGEEKENEGEGNWMKNGSETTNGFGNGKRKKKGLSPSRPLLVVLLDALVDQRSSPTVNVATATSASTAATTSTPSSTSSIKAPSPVLSSLSTSPSLPSLSFSCPLTDPLEEAADREMEDSLGKNWHLPGTIWSNWQIAHQPTTVGIGAIKSPRLSFIASPNGAGSPGRMPLPTPTSPLPPLSPLSQSVSSASSSAFSSSPSSSASTPCLLPPLLSAASASYFPIKKLVVLIRWQLTIAEKHAVAQKWAGIRQTMGQAGGGGKGEEVRTGDGKEKKTGVKSSAPSPTHSRKGSIVKGVKMNESNTARSPAAHSRKSSITSGSATPVTSLPSYHQSPSSSSSSHPPSHSHHHRSASAFPGKLDSLSPLHHLSSSTPSLHIHQDSLPTWCKYCTVVHCTTNKCWWNNCPGAPPTQQQIAAANAIQEMLRRERGRKLGKLTVGGSGSPLGSTASSSASSTSSSPRSASSTGSHLAAAVSSHKWLKSQQRLSTGSGGGGLGGRSSSSNAATTTSNSSNSSNGGGGGRRGSISSLKSGSGSSSNSNSSSSSSINSSSSTSTAAGKKPVTPGSRGSITGSSGSNSKTKAGSASTNSTSEAIPLYLVDTPSTLSILSTSRARHLSLLPCLKLRCRPHQLRRHCSKLSKRFAPVLWTEDAYEWMNEPKTAPVSQTAVRKELISMRWREGQQQHNTWQYSQSRRGSASSSLRAPLSPIPKTSTSPLSFLFLLIFFTLHLCSLLSR